jgi:hypothetical protein
MSPTSKSLRSYPMLGMALALATLTVTGSASASTKQEMNATFVKYSFEYRNAGRPYGLPIRHSHHVANAS